MLAATLGALAAPAHAQAEAEAQSSSVGSAVGSSADSSTDSSAETDAELAGSPLRREGETAAATADVSGVMVSEPADAPAPGRHLLVVPRAAAQVVAMPLRGGLTVYERHHVRERLVDLFFNDSRTFGIYPTIALETRLTPGVGARLVHKDLFGVGAGLRLGGNYGGESRYRLEGGLTSPTFAGGVLRTRVAGGWQRQPSAVFYGIGDQDLVAADTLPVGLPARSPGAVSTHFAQQMVHAEFAFEVNPAGPVFAAVSTAYIGREFGTGEGPPDDLTQVDRTDVRFDTTTLAGWGQGTKVSYTEAQIGWNSLTAANSFIPAGAPSSGTKVVAFAGLARNVGGAGSADVAYTRYGADAFRYFDLYGGDRVLILRGRMEGVAGAEDRIPFTDLPRLGGPVLLRGFTRDRFRDRVGLLASVEYRYPIWRQLGGYLFVDAGRVVPNLGAAKDMFTAPDLLRVGGGGGLEILQGEIFRMRAQVAGSPEGFFFQLALEPVYRLPTHNYRI